MYCDYQTFEQRVHEMLPSGFQVNQSLLGELFSLLDVNHDGVLDINEIGGTLGPFYSNKPEMYDVTRIWGVVSRADWIPNQILIQKLSEASGVDTKISRYIVKDINLEGTPNVTIWQLLRSFNTQGGMNFTDLIQSSGYLKQDQSVSHLQSIGAEQAGPVAQTPQIYSPVMIGKREGYPHDESYYSRQVSTHRRQSPKTNQNNDQSLENQSHYQQKQSVNMSVNKPQTSNLSNSPLYQYDQRFGSDMKQSTISEEKYVAPDVTGVVEYFSPGKNQSIVYESVDKKPGDFVRTTFDQVDHSFTSSNQYPLKLNRQKDASVNHIEFEANQTSNPSPKLKSSSPRKDEPDQNESYQVRMYPNDSFSLGFNNSPPKKELNTPSKKDKQRESIIKNLKIQQSEKRDKDIERIEKENREQERIYQELKEKEQHEEMKKQRIKELEELEEKSRKQREETQKKWEEAMEKKKLDERKKKEKEIEALASQLETVRQEYQHLKVQKENEIKTIEEARLSQEKQILLKKNELKELRQNMEALRLEMINNFEREKKEQEKKLEVLRSSASKLQKENDELLRKKEEILKAKQNQAQNKENIDKNNQTNPHIIKAPPRFQTPPILKKKKKPEKITLQDILRTRISLNLNSVDCRSMADYLIKALGERNFLTFPQFTHLMSSCKPKKVNPNQYKRNLWTLYQFLDYNKDGTCDRTELANTLILLCGGDKKEKIEASFKFYDKDQSGTLSPLELVDYFKGVVKLKCRGSEKNVRLNDQEIGVVAASIVKKAFQDIDTDDDSFLTLQEFTSWILNKGNLDSQVRTSFLNQKRKSRGSRDLSFIGNKKDQNHDLNNLKNLIDDVRLAVPLQKIHISVAFKYLRETKSNLKALDKQSFKNYLLKLVKKCKLKIRFKDCFDSLPTLVFKVFDFNKSGLLERKQLGIPLLVLCGMLFSLINSRRNKEGKADVLCKNV